MASKKGQSKTKGLEDVGVYHAHQRRMGCSDIRERPIAIFVCNDDTPWSQKFQDIVAGFSRTTAAQMATQSRQSIFNWPPTSQRVLGTYIVECRVCILGIIVLISGILGIIVMISGI